MQNESEGNEHSLFNNFFHVFIQNHQISDRKGEKKSPEKTFATFGTHTNANMTAKLFYYLSLSVELIHENCIKFDKRR